MKKRMTRLNRLAGALIIFSGGLLLSGCAQFGAIPSGQYLELVQASPNYNADIGGFVNRNPGIMDNVGDDVSFWDDPFGRERPNFIFNCNQTSPNAPMPEERTQDFTDFLESASTIKFIWLGHSSILLSIEGKTVLIDPVFSDYASPVPLIVRRFQPPVIKIDDLPKIDYIVISHDHYDHLDMETIKHFTDRDVKFILPLGVGAHLRRWGIAASKMIELDWWEEADLGGAGPGSLSFVATPAQHFSGRTGISSKMETLWASWVIKSPTRRMFFSGDSGYDTHYKSIGERLGPFDLVFMDSGQYNERWRAVHNMPHDVITGFMELRGNYLVPVHWGMFDMSLHNWFDPPSKISKLAKQNNINLITPRLGAIIRLEDPPLFDEWWREVK